MSKRLVNCARSIALSGDGVVGTLVRDLRRGGRRLGRRCLRRPRPGCRGSCRRLARRHLRRRRTPRRRRGRLGRQRLGNALLNGAPLWVRRGEPVYPILEGDRPQGCVAHSACKIEQSRQEAIGNVGRDHVASGLGQGLVVGQDCRQVDLAAQGLDHTSLAPHPVVVVGVIATAGIPESVVSIQMLIGTRRQPTIRREARIGAVGVLSPTGRGLLTFTVTPPRASTISTNPSRFAMT